jgi:hypothetical protein
MAERIGGIEAVVTMDVSQLQTSSDMAVQHLNRVATATMKVDAAAKSSSGGMNSFGSKMMIVGQFADDVQYGLRAVVNQIPQVAMAFGAGAGLAGALSVVAVAANQLVNNWDTLSSVLASGGSETATEKMERLAKATEKARFEAEQLSRQKRQDETIKSQEAGRHTDPLDSKGQEIVENAIKLKDGEYDRILKAVMQSNAVRVQQNPITDADVSQRAAQLAGASGQYGGAGVVGLMGAAREQLESDRKRLFNQQLKEQAQRLIADAQTAPGREGDNARTIIADALKENSSNPELEGKFRSATRPALKAEQERLKRRERDYNEGLGIAGEEAGERILQDQMEKDRLAQAKGAEGLEEERRKKNTEAWQKFDQGVDKFKALDERQMSLRQRLIENNRDNSGSGVGQSMGLDEYDSSIKSEGWGRIEAKQEETNRILKEIQKGWQQYKVIAVEQRGG